MYLYIDCINNGVSMTNNMLGTEIPIPHKIIKIELTQEQEEIINKNKQYDIKLLSIQKE